MALPRYAPDVHADDHRCFIMDAPEDSGPILTGLGVRTQSGSALHHLMMFSLPFPASVDHAHGLDAQDDKPGFPCEGHPQIFGSELLSVWTPGQGTVTFPSGTGVAMENRVVLVQTHFHVEDPTVEADRPDRRPEMVLKHGTARSEVVTLTLHTADHVPTLMRPVPIAATTFTLPPGREHADVSLSGPAPFPESVVVHGVFPHMHTTGSTIRLDTGADDETQCLTQSTRWRFGQQDTAFFKTPKVLDPSTPLTLSCTWDTRHRRHETHWGEDSLDEMCTVFLFVSTVGGGDVR